MAWELTQFGLWIVGPLAAVFLLVWAAGKVQDYFHP
jgi:hypothetical protein